MKYKKAKVEIIEFGENEFMAGSWDPASGSCSGYTHTGGAGATHACGTVTDIGEGIWGSRRYSCSSHSCTNYAGSDGSGEFTCWSYA